MLFNLRNDIGEYRNVTPNHPKLAQEMYDEMMRYLGDVGARMPKVPNPDYDQDVYESDGLYERRLLWGPFEGNRQKEEDER